VQNKRESLDTFRKDSRRLASLAEQKSALIVVTNLQNRKRMDRMLHRTAHVSLRLDDKNTFTQLTLTKHPSTPQLKATLSKGKQTLERYL